MLDIVENNVSITENESFWRKPAGALIPRCKAPEGREIDLGPRTPFQWVPNSGPGGNQGGGHPPKLQGTLLQPALGYFWCIFGGFWFGAFAFSFGKVLPNVTRVFLEEVIFLRGPLQQFFFHTQEIKFGCWSQDFLSFFGTPPQ